MHDMEFVEDYEVPHVELKYTDDLPIDCEKIFFLIEQTINKADPAAGACKSRAYRISDYLHTHLYVHITVLKKDHRDDVFMRSLLNSLSAIVAAALPVGCYFSLELDFAGDYYITSKVGS